MVTLWKLLAKTGAVFLLSPFFVGLLFCQLAAAQGETTEFNRPFQRWLPLPSGSQVPGTQEQLDQLRLLQSLAQQYAGQKNGQDPQLPQTDLRQIEEAFKEFSKQFGNVAPDGLQNIPPEWLNQAIENDEARQQVEQMLQRYARDRKFPQSNSNQSNSSNSVPLPNSNTNQSHSSSSKTGNSMRSAPGTNKPKNTPDSSNQPQNTPKANTRERNPLGPNATPPDSPVPNESLAPKNDLLLDNDPFEFKTSAEAANQASSRSAIKPQSAAQPEPNNSTTGSKPAPLDPHQIESLQQILEKIKSIQTKNSARDDTTSTAPRLSSPGRESLSQPNSMSPQSNGMSPQPIGVIPQPNLNSTSPEGSANPTSTNTNPLNSDWASEWKKQLEQANSSASNSSPMGSSSTARPSNSPSEISKKEAGKKGQGAAGAAGAGDDGSATGVARESKGEIREQLQKLRNIVQETIKEHNTTGKTESQIDGGAAGQLSGNRPQKTSLNSQDSGGFKSPQPSSPPKANFPTPTMPAPTSSNPTSSKPTSTNGLGKMVNEFFKTVSTPPAPEASPKSSPSSNASGFSWSLSNVDWTTLLIGAIVLVSLLVAVLLLRKQAILTTEEKATQAELMRELAANPIRTRVDVVRAFHRMLYRSPNPVSLWWTHWYAAQRYAETAPKYKPVLHELSQLYECARYLPPDHEFSSEQLERVHKAVLMVSS